jgi:uncharacterized protein YcfL
MKSYLSALAISALLLSGCSSTTPDSKPEYDELSVIQWQTCLNHFIEANKGFYSTSEITTFRATEACTAFLPEKK